MVTVLIQPVRGRRAFREFIDYAYDRNAADPVIREQFRKFLYRSIGRNCNNVGGHYVGRTHRISLPTRG